MLLEFKFVLDSKWKFHYAYSTFKLLFAAYSSDFNGFMHTAQASFMCSIKLWTMGKLLKGKELTVNHLHLKATSRTVLSGNAAAILMYFMILGSLA